MTINASFYTVYMFSGILLVVPLFKIITALGIYDTEIYVMISRMVFPFRWNTRLSGRITTKATAINSIMQVSA